MIEFIVFLLALGICFGINALDKRRVVNPGRAAAIALTVLALIEIAAVLFMPSSTNGRAYQLGAVLGRAIVPLIIALYISQKFKERQSAPAVAPQSETSGTPRDAG